MINAHYWMDAWHAAPQRVRAKGQHREYGEAVEHSGAPGFEQRQLERLARKAGREFWAYHDKRLRSESLQLMEYGSEHHWASAVRLAD